MNHYTNAIGVAIIFKKRVYVVYIEMSESYNLRQYLSIPAKTCQYTCHCTRSLSISSNVRVYVSSEQRESNIV